MEGEDSGPYFRQYLEARDQMMVRSNGRSYGGPSKWDTRPSTEFILITACPTGVKEGHEYFKLLEDTPDGHQFVMATRILHSAGPCDPLNTEERLVIV
ncbi:hypothetical protein KIPB_008359 [Kipferlia bialata]|uniref:Uncharacterized protein n=1 Tax=Kipferlia bialata TaxID=797122 RepID=A0A9K3D0J8_9EUKA|nr:hypothetical protein KIPB_008359 [Kipferlia bialata]|eukprot:g8359.t1